MTAPRRPRRLRTVLLLLAGFAGLGLLFTWLLPRQAMPVPPAVVQVQSGQPDGGAPETMPIEDVARWTEAAREPGTLLRFPMRGGAPAGGDPSWLPEAYRTIETLGSLTEEETGYFIRICMSSMRMVCTEMEELLQRQASMAANDFALAHARLTHNSNVSMCAADALAKGRYILVRGGDEYPGVPLLAATHEQCQLLLDRQSIDAGVQPAARGRTAPHHGGAARRDHGPRAVAAVERGGAAGLHLGPRLGDAGADALRLGRDVGAPATRNQLAVAGGCAAGHPRAGAVDSCPI